MPYKDPEKQKEAKRKYYRRKYAEDPDFVEAERQRKLAHYAANREERLPQMRAYSQEWYAKVEKKRRKALAAPEKKGAASVNGRRPAAKKASAKVARKLVAKTVKKSKAEPMMKVKRGPKRALKRPSAKTSRAPRSRAAVPAKKARPVKRRR